MKTMPKRLGTAIRSLCHNTRKMTNRNEEITETNLLSILRKVYSYENATTTIKRICKQDCSRGTGRI